MGPRRQGFLYVDSPQIGFGGWAIGGSGWGAEIDEKQSHSALLRAYEMGLRLFETAPAYGESERIIGSALSRQRESVTIATKTPPRGDPRESLESSLSRMGTEYVDLLQLHEPSVDFEKRLEAMAELIEEGKALAMGICNATASQIERALSVAPIVTYQAQYNLFDTDAEKRELPLCIEKQISFLAYRPLASGLLSGAFKADRPFALSDHRRGIYWFKGEELERRLRVVAKISEIAAKSGSTVAGIALSWLLSRTGVSYVLMGARTAEQVEKNLKAVAAGGSKEDLDEVDRVVQQVFKVPLATSRLKDEAKSWADPESFIVARLDGKKQPADIAAEWPDDQGKPLISAQVKVFIDQLRAEGYFVE